MTLVETFGSSTPQRQMTLVFAGAAVILALLVAIYLLFLRTPYEVLFADLRPTDAATIVAELDKKKVPYRLDDGGATILVPKDQVAGTRLAVMSEDLPLKGMVGFELFNKSDMGLTEFAQKINYQRALQGELARTIMTIDAVETARVHLALGEQTIFRADRVPPKASVTVVARLGRVLTAGSVRGIQRLVAAAVPELELDNVVVLDKRGEVLSGELASAPSAAPLVQARQAIEDYYAGRIRMALLRAYPATGVEVRVFAPELALERPAGGHAPLVESWTPASRTFGLDVTVSTATSLASEQQVEFRYLVSEAVNLRPELGDAVHFTVAPVAPVAVPARPSVAPTPWDAPKEGRALGSNKLSLFNLALVFALPLTLLLFAAAFFAEQRRGPRRLTVRQQSEYADKFRTLLERDEVDVRA